MAALRAYLKPGDLLLVLIFVPLALSFDRLSARFGDDLGDSLLMVGRGCGILGLSMILTAGIVSIRIPRLDRAFGGLTRLWKLHHLLGFGGFVLVFVHVELIALSALPISRELPARVLFPALSSTSVWLGWLALLALTVFLAPSFKFFGPPRYQGWKLLHMIAAPTGLLLAVLHATGFGAQSTVWWVIGAMAVASVAWRRIGSRLTGRLPYTVVSIEKLAPDVVQISLQPERHALHYRPGQFIYMTPTDTGLQSGRLEEHPYSLSSSPHEGLLRLGIKDLGDASRSLQQLRPTTAVWIEGPYGDFFARHYPERGQLWLGGGIGITPMVGGARAIASEGNAGPGGVHLVYLADSMERAYYRTVLLDCVRQAEGLELTEHYFSSEGPLTPAFLEKHCPDFREREAYLCGPPPMLAYLRRVLKSEGITGSRIHSEEFTFL